MRNPPLITAVGLVSSLGIGADAFFERVVRGESRFSSRSLVDRERHPVMPPVFGAFVADFSVFPFLGRRGVRMLSRESQFLMSAAVMAVREAGLSFDTSEGRTLGVFAGTTLAGLADYAELFTDSLMYGVDRINPSQGPQTGFNAPAAQLSVHFNIGGPNITLNTGVAAGLTAIAYAAEFIERGEIHAALAGGVDALSFPGANALVARDPERHSQEPPIPFEAARSGVVYGEGASLLVIEEAEYARERGARGLAVLAGAGSAFEPGDGRADLESACARAIQECLDKAAVSASSVDAVFASACGDRLIDAAEAFALHECLGSEVPVFALKGSVGECLGAGAAMQMATAAFSIKKGIVPATLGFSSMDPELPPLKVVREPINLRPQCVLITSVDRYGHAAAAILTMPAR